MDSNTETTDQATLFTVLAGRRYRDVDVAGREVEGRIKYATRLRWDLSETV